MIDPRSYTLEHVRAEISGSQYAAYQVSGIRKLGPEVFAPVVKSISLINR